MLWRVGEGNVPWRNGIGSPVTGIVIGSRLAASRARLQRARSVVHVRDQPRGLLPTPLSARAVDGPGARRFKFGPRTAGGRCHGCKPERRAAVHDEIGTPLAESERAQGRTAGTVTQ